MNASHQQSAAAPVARRPTFLSPVLRILIVIDGRVELHKFPNQFGLGYALDALMHMPSFAGVSLGIATRETSIDDFGRGGHDILYTGFKFDQADFEINLWDQIWLFADQPHKDDGAPTDTDDLISDPAYELSNAEVLRLVQWMDRGGGVFAVGDHSILGASMCHRIPRVRTMRRWTRANGVPENDGPTRNQTVQPSTSAYPERDLLLQPVELAHVQVMTHLPFGIFERPHALMCTPYGPIEHFPDHMHEGEVVPEEQVRVDLALNIPNYQRLEYPYSDPAYQPFGRPNPAALRPRPQVIAYGRTTNMNVIAPPVDIDGTAGNAAYRLYPPGTRRFGLVSIYDGAQANVGRVVVESTWHHWFSYNLDGIAHAGSGDFAKMMSYYRNVALWLANADQRREMAIAAIWAMLTLDSPMAFAGRRTVWEMGEKATELLIDSLSPCWINELASSQFDATSLYVVARFEDSPNQGPTWGGLSEVIVQRAVFGSLCVALWPLAQEVQRQQRLHNDVKIDRREILTAAAHARAQTPRVLKACIDEAAATYKALGERCD